MPPKPGGSTSLSSQFGVVTTMEASHCCYSALTYREICGVPLRQNLEAYVMKRSYFTARLASTTSYYNRWYALSMMLSGVSEIRSGGMKKYDQ
jgi:hypothetical protein